ncbi:MAG: glycosyltransferase family 8 protein [Lachnospiraceae bacterium]|nr:glycosyltransferase family 8 protein [Lachnospiraceae bacterium]
MTINIAVVTNQKYVPRMLVMVHSLFSQNREKSFCVYILHSGLSETCKKTIEKRFGEEHQSCRLLEIDDAMLSDVPIKDQNLSREAYFKLLIPKLIPQDIPRILYLDSDMIILGDIQGLYEYDLKGKALGAVRDLYMDRDILYKTRLMPQEYTYFNSGVLLIDMERFREVFDFNGAMHYIEENGHQFRFHDQEVLNALCYREVTILPEIYNYVTLYRDRFDPLWYRRREKKLGIIVLHYAAHKPWNPDYTGKYLERYWEAACRIGSRGEYRQFRRARRKVYPRIFKTIFCTIVPNFKSNCRLALNPTWLRHWIKYYGRTKFGKLYRMFGGKYVKRDFLSAEETNEYIRQGLLADGPFMACRLGANESFTMRTYEFHHLANEKKAVEQLCTHAGFFPNEKAYAERFAALMRESMGQMDWCGVLQCPFDDYFLNRYSPKNCKAGILYTIDPVVYQTPWTQALAGKKVLVIHPFAKTIEAQYEKRALLFPGRNVLPDFELHTIRAVQTSAGERDQRFQDWFEALDHMEREIAHTDFDIALLACGAYGFPLAARIKQMGKKAVHIGGGLQILFGIKGRRWDQNPTISRMYNEAWVYPDDSETPKGAAMVEGACYWK